MKLAARTVQLSARGERIIFDYDGRLYRIVHYRAKFNRQTRKIDGEQRTSAKHAHLYEALVIVLGEAESSQDPRTVEAYMRATRWGRELP